MIYTVPARGYCHHRIICSTSALASCLYIIFTFFCTCATRLSASHISFVVALRHATPPSLPPSFCSIPLFYRRHSYICTSRPPLHNNISFYLSSSLGTLLRTRTAPMTRHTALLLLLYLVS